jgi:catechol 2,3-dioxygenase-like lactoylglutathione lyase family enzyme
VLEFYAELLGLRRDERLSDGGRLALVGRERSGPRVIVSWQDEELRPSVRRDLLLELGSLEEVIEALTEHRLDFERISGFFPYDRRLAVADPAGNRVELATCHWF